MKLFPFVVCALLCATQTSSEAQGFVYPVGNPEAKPTRSLPNANGFIITAGFGDEDGHTGVDLANGSEGAEVRAIGAGTVSLRAETANSSGFGNVIMIRHDLPEGTFYSLYAHLQDGSLLVNVGDFVVPGSPIGKVDCSGTTRGRTPCLSNNQFGPHLHFSIKRQNTLGCGYISSRCTSGDVLEDYIDDPLGFIESRMGSIRCEAGGQLFASGDIRVEVLPGSAGYVSDIYLSVAGRTPIWCGINQAFGVVTLVNDLPVDTALQFYIYVRDTNLTFYQDPSSPNPDGLVHAVVECLTDQTAVISFEDLLFGGDLDYDDARIQVQTR